MRSITIYSLEGMVHGEHPSPGHPVRRAMPALHFTNCGGHRPPYQL